MEIDEIVIRPTAQDFWGDNEPLTKRRLLAFIREKYSKRRTQ
jgi:hypothetical protein